MVKKISKEELALCADCTCFNIRKTSRVVTQVYDELMHETDLRGTQFTVLVMVAAFGPVTISLLADNLVMDRTTLTRNLKPLEKRGLLEIVPGEDRRTRAVQLMDAGHDMLSEALPLWREAQQKIAHFMGKERLDNLLGELRSLEKMAK
ncbi:MAG: MarR family winged helix-turn-helix transcriptional regulator [Candidatus Thiodiazotropha sp. (ex Dulcina madagascariensis)]|nr:MarR family winged helix-turn-helix transcriptional regulator [Candidatus Thiodiazotropha sp. (ex Dulcina madagascariensis)]